MRRDMLRAALLCIGLGLLAGAAVLAIGGCGPGPVLRLALPGIILAGAVIVERWRYGRLASGRPGPEWIATGERFVDPETGRLVSVYYHPSTGERRYTTG